MATSFTKLSFFLVLLFLTATMKNSAVLGQPNENEQTPTLSPTEEETILETPFSSSVSGNSAVQTGTTSETASSGSGYPPCNICGPGKVIGNPEAPPTNDEDSEVETCAQLQEFGNNGTISPEFCEELPDRVEITCGCREATENTEPSDSAASAFMDTTALIAVIVFAVHLVV